MLDSIGFLWGSKVFLVHQRSGWVGDLLIVVTAFPVDICQIKFFARKVKETFFALVYFY